MSATSQTCPTCNRAIVPSEFAQEHSNLDFPNEWFFMHCPRCKTLFKVKIVPEPTFVIQRL